MVKRSHSALRKTVAMLVATIAISLTLTPSIGAFSLRTQTIVQAYVSPEIEIAQSNLRASVAVTAYASPEIEIAMSVLNASVAVTSHASPEVEIAGLRSQRAVLMPGESLEAGESLYSPNGNFELTLQTDGNLVLRDLSVQEDIWSSNTAGHEATHLMMQHDGNLALYKPPIRPYHLLWNSRTDGWSQTYATVRDNGTLTVNRRDGRVLWTVGTSTPQTAFVDTKHVVYQRGDQRVWLIEADGSVRDSFLVSGRASAPHPGSYRVYSKSERAWAYVPGVTMDHMVRFATGSEGGNIGFHAIPISRGRGIQSVDQLGTPLSAGCVRMHQDKARQMFDWADLGTPVLVTA